MSLLDKRYIGYDKNKLLNRKLDINNYKIIVRDIYKHFDINDKILCFFHGLGWYIVSLNDMLSYPVLYYKFWSQKYETYYTNTLLVCPITMRTMIYKGKIKIIDVINDRLLLKNTDTKDEFFMDLPYTGHTDKFGKEKKIKSQVKKIEVKMFLLRDAFRFINDPKYIIIKQSKKPLISEKYYNNRLTYLGYPIYTTFHPKTIVYMVQYYSFSDKKYKYLCIVGKNINKDKVTGYNYKESGIANYLNENKSKLIKIKAYIYPIFWYMVDVLYKNVKFITII